MSCVMRLLLATMPEEQLSAKDTLASPMRRADCEQNG